MVVPEKTSGLREVFRNPSHLLVVFTPSSCSCALLWLKTGLVCRVSKTKALSERCEQQCFAKGLVELQTVVRSFSKSMGTVNPLSWCCNENPFSSLEVIQPPRISLQCKQWLCHRSDDAPFFQPSRKLNIPGPLYWKPPTLGVTHCNATCMRSSHTCHAQGHGQNSSNLRHCQSHLDPFSAALGLEMPF